MTSGFHACYRLVCFPAIGLILAGCGLRRSGLELGELRTGSHTGSGTPQRHLPNRQRSGGFEHNKASELAESSRTPWSLLESSNKNREAVHIVDLVFDVVRIDLPLGGIQESRKIWNHVDELRIDPVLTARLARNGLRMGAASPAAWEPIRAIIEAVGAKVRRERLIPQRGLALVIKLASLKNGESIFSYQRNGELFGKTFAAGEKLLDLDYVYHPELGGFTDLQLHFEVRRDRGVMTWEKRAGLIREVPAVDRYVFSDLNAQLTLNRKQFLVIGLSDQATNRFLVGSRFLSFERSGKRYETLLCITPQPFQTQGVTVKPP